MKTIYLAGCSILLVIFVTPAFAQRFGATVTIDESTQSDQYVAGRIVRVNAPINGDLVVAGQRLIVGADIGGDLIAAGATVDVRNAVADDVRAAGRTVILGAPVSGHIVAAGETVTLEQGSSVAQWAWLAGRTVSVGGSVGEDLRAAGESISLSGRVEGDANLIGQRIEVGPAAFIGGDLIVQGQAEPVVADGATIVGEIIREDLPDDEGGLAPIRWMRCAAGFVYFTATLITAVLVIGLLFPRFSRATSDRSRSTPLRALGAGLLAAIGIPVLTALVFMTGIGLIVGFGLLGSYLLALLLAMLLGIIAVGHLGLELLSKGREPQRSRTILALIVGTVVVLLVLQIPFLGGLVLIFLTLIGFGAATAELWARYQQAA